MKDGKKEAAHTAWFTSVFSADRSAYADFLANQNTSRSILALAAMEKDRLSW